jgi:predicted ATPase
LQRIDTFSGIGRTILNLSAVLGLSFVLAELIAILVHIPGHSDADGTDKEDTADKESHGLEQSVRDALCAGVAAGIMYVEFSGEEYEEAEVSSGESEFVPEDCAPGDLTYFFAHDMWRAAILKLVLDKRKRQLHEAVASTLELNYDNAADDFVSQIRIFNHWKHSGNVTKAGEIALAVGKTYEGLGLAVQSARLYQEATNVGTQKSAQLEILIKLHVAAGRALASALRFPESVLEYECALKVCVVVLAKT